MAKGFNKLMSGVLSSLEKKASFELEDIFSEEVIPKVQANLMAAYDKLLANKEPGYDPARPSVARAAFEHSIESSLLGTLKLRGTKISLSTGNEAELGYNKHTLSHLKSGVGRDPNPLDWLIFYLEGFIGDFYFVTKSDFEAFVAAGLRSAHALDVFESWGWYGQGFLIPAKTYRAQKFHTVAGVNHKKHPFSGQSPIDIFEMALDGIDIVAIVDRAIAQAVEKFR